MFWPDRYLLKYECTMKPTRMPRNDTDQYITTKVHNLSSCTTSVTIPDLQPNSMCLLYLFAVYNPASIDKGLARIGNTLREDARDLNPGLHYVHVCARARALYIIIFTLCLDMCIRHLFHWVTFGLWSGNANRLSHCNPNFSPSLQSLFSFFLAFSFLFACLSLLVVAYSHSNLVHYRTQVTCRSCKC